MIGTCTHSSSSTRFWEIKPPRCEVADSIVGNKRILPPLIRRNRTRNNEPGVLLSVTKVTNGLRKEQLDHHSSQLEVAIPMSVLKKPDYSQHTPRRWRNVIGIIDEGTLILVHGEAINSKTKSVSFQEVAGDHYDTEDLLAILSSKCENTA